jgi:anti-sigma regulatory factor (Ser/Thr protein kinase)
MKAVSGSERPEPFWFPHSCAVMLPAAAIAPKICRDFVTGVLDLIGFGHLAERAALCTSELVTNVHRYAGGTVHLQFTADLTRVRVSVYDNNPVRPTLCVAGDEDQRGRGLGLVDVLADRWGVSDSQLGLPVKGVWFELHTLRAVA